MRVLMINQFPLIGGGSGFYTKTIAKSLRDAGHDVCIVIPENTTDIEKLEGIEIHPVYFKYKENIEGQIPFNFGCFTTHPRSNKTFNDYSEEELKIYVKAFEKKLKEVIDKFKPDIIHSGHIWIVSSIASKFNIPLVITSHGTDIIGYKNWDRFHKFASEAMQNASKIIAISESNKTEILKIFPDAKNKIVELRNGYDQSIFHKEVYDKKQVLKEIGLEDKYKNIVLFSGRLVEVKGVDVLLKAAKIYENEGILTLIAGEGILHKELEKQAQDLNLKNVKFLGNMKQEVLNKLYNIADTTVLTSRYEGFALVVIESLACGTPVVASNIDVMNDFMKEEFGLLFKKDNENELAKKIKKILNNKDKYDNEIISNYIKDKFAQNILIDKVIDVYKSCLVKKI